MRKQFAIQYVLTVVILFILVWLWEFYIEVPLTDDPESDVERWRFIIHVVVFGMMALVLPTVISIREMTKRLKTQNEIKELRSIIPICMYCKKVRTDKDVWDKFEHYIQEHYPAHFSHGLCPDCLKEQMQKLTPLNTADSRAL